MNDRPAPLQLRLAELLGALSHALDLTEGQPKGHCIRCCWMGTQLGYRMKLWPEDIAIKPPSLKLTMLSLEDIYRDASSLK